jgi:tetratricopeptide (TPR) repeat protein
MMNLARTLAICLALALPSAALAQQPGTGPAPAAPDFATVFKAANASYNDGEYAEAIRGYRAAVALEPARAETYRNMARAYFWLGQYAAAVAYYDMFLTEFPDHSGDEQVQRERKLAASRATEPWNTPPDQRAALGKLQRELSRGAGLLADGTGAWTAYEALLRTGYAHPNLIRLRARVAEALIREHDAALVQKPSQPAPLLDLEAWALQRARLEAAAQVADSPELRDTLTRRGSLHAAATELLLGRYVEAAKAAEAAAKANPDMLFAQWFLITALTHANRPDDALARLDALVPRLRDEAPTLLPYERVVRAIVYQKLGRDDEAADIYIEALSRD